MFFLKDPEIKGPEIVPKCPEILSSRLQEFQGSDYLILDLFKIIFLLSD